MEAESLEHRTGGLLYLIFDREGYSPALFKELWEDTLKIVAYRAETALAQILAETIHAHHRDEARGLAHWNTSAPN